MIWEIIFGTTIWEIIFSAAIVALITLPPRYDPAVRLKEWLQKDKDS